MTRRPLRRLLPLTLFPLLLPLLGAKPPPELGPRPPRTTQDRVEARRHHWEMPRAYPAGRIPDGAYAEASAAFGLIPAVHPAGPVSHSPLPAPPKPEDAVWTFLGPAPLDTTQA